MRKKLRPSSDKYREAKLRRPVKRSAWLKFIIIGLLFILLFDIFHEKKGYGKTDTVSTGAYTLFSNNTNMNMTTPMKVGMQIGAMLGFQKEIENNDPLGFSLRMGTGEESKVMEHSRDVLFEPGTLGPQDTPFFWVIPKSGTSTIKTIMAKCLNLRKAISTGQIEYDSYNELQLVDSDNGGQFVNVDFGYLSGIKKAKQWKMAESGLVDVVATSYIHEATTEVFSPARQARIFTIIRHPIERLISGFYYQKVAVWEKTFDASRDTNITLLEYATNSKNHVDNWMTRMLSNRHNGPVQDVDYEYAQKVLKEKVLILLLEDIDEGMVRLFAFMNWANRLEQTSTGSSGEECIDTYLNSKRANAHHDDRKHIDMESEEWRALEAISSYDLHLYEYAKSLYDGEQKALYDKKE